MISRVRMGLVCLIGLAVLACEERAVDVPGAETAPGAALPDSAAESRIVRKLPALALRAPAGDPGDPAGPARLTAAELEAAGHRFVETFGGGRRQVDTLIDRDRLAARALPTSASQRALGEARKQAGDWSIALLTRKDGSQAELIGVRPEGPLTTAVVRTQVLDQVDYLELILERSPTGDAKLVDVFRHRLGLYESDRVRQAVGHAPETEVFGKFSSGTREMLRLALGEVSNDPRGALALLARLPVGVNTSREIVLLRWAVGSGNGGRSIVVPLSEPIEPEYTDALRVAIRALDDSPSLVFARLDLAVREGDRLRALAELDALCAAFGDDARLEIAAAQLERAAGHEARAQARLERSLAADDEWGHWAALAMHLAAGDAEAAHGMLQEIETRFDYALGEAATPALDRLAQRCSQDGCASSSLGVLLASGPRLRRELGAALTGSSPGEVLRYRDTSGQIHFVARRADLPRGQQSLDPVLAHGRSTAEPADAALAALRERVRKGRRKLADLDRGSGDWQRRRRVLEQAIEYEEHEIEKLDSEPAGNCDEHYTDLRGRSRTRLRPNCMTNETKKDLARRQIEEAQNAIENLGEQCREAGCQPGWVR